MKKYSTLILLLLIVALTSACSGWKGAEKSYPDNVSKSKFRDMEWGAYFEEIEGLVIADPASPVKSYVRKNENLMFGDVEVENIYYGFFNDMFCAVVLTFTAPDVAPALRDHLVELHGPPAESSELGGGLFFSWDAPELEIDLSYHNKGSLTYRYKPIFHQIRK